MPLATHRSGHHPAVALSSPLLAQWLVGCWTHLCPLSLSFFHLETTTNLVLETYHFYLEVSLVGSLRISAQGLVVITIVNCLGDRCKSPTKL